MAVTLSPSGLVVMSAYGETGWAAVYNNNFSRLNSTLLKISGMFDVNVTGLTVGQILCYSTATSKWVPVTPPTRKKAAYA